MALFFGRQFRQNSLQSSHYITNNISSTCREQLQEHTDEHNNKLQHSNQLLLMLPLPQRISTGPSIISYSNSPGRRITQDDESSTTPSNAGHHDGCSQAAVANNNNIDNGTAAPPAAAAATAAANNRTNRVPSNRLLRLRQNFNATGVRREARSASTFDGHHRNNIRFLLYIYGNKPE